MKPVPADEFLKWAADGGVGFDPRYPNSGSLGFLPPSDCTRFWVLPGDPATWPHFAASLLKGMDSWTSGYLWPRAGCWPTAAKSSRRNDRIRDVVLRGAGIPDGWEGA